MTVIQRCSWAGNDPDYCRYHDLEWGVPVHDDTKLFEMIILEGFQAGLSWLTILKKRDHFKKAFLDWDYEAIAAFSGVDTERLMSNRGIIRNRLKITSAVKNAKAFIKLRKEFGSFNEYIWRFTNYKTIFPSPPPKTVSEIPTHSKESDLMSKDLKRRGFSFVGTVICYSFMQAVGMVNDHMEGCFKCYKGNT
ncbi:DNA-3-methyladenine glycosylase [Chitinispirillum alkaliphilum]|nr:DNA-3-methyladenine glycosylase [Chitinispirillum alkaliphilum]